jgi:hypothetical protein
MKHALRRTSPYGQDFVGTCYNCMKTNLKFSDLWEECENPAGRGEADTLKAAIEDRKH